MSRIDQAEVKIRQLQGQLKNTTQQIIGSVSPGGGTFDSGFTCAHTATGFYTVTYRTPFAVPPVTVVTVRLAAGYATLINEDGTGFVVATISSTGVSADRSFSFLTVSR